MINCPICNTESSTKRDNTPYWICSSCELWFQSPLPPKIYEAAHELNELGESIGHLMGDEEKNINNNLAVWLFNTYMKNGDKALDIGSKYPYLSYCLKKCGADAYGMDNINAVPEYSKNLGVPLLLNDFEKWDTGIEHVSAYKLISMVHLFEHLYDPKAALLKAYDLLSSDGVLYIRSPANDVKGIERDLTEGHYTIHPYIHSINSILELLYQLRDKFVVEFLNNSANFGQRDLILRKVDKKPLICAGMIVKNEERDIPSLLHSVHNVIDELVVVDTGSVDNTKNTVLKYFPQADYSIYLEASEQDEIGDWKLWDFSKARNVFIDIIDKKDVEWVLWLDADDTVLHPEKLRRLAYLKHFDVFEINMHPDIFGQHRMWKNHLGIKFEGAVHEYPTIGGFNAAKTNIGILHNYAPGSGENSNARNLRILLRTYEKEPTTRNTFYLAQTYHHGGKYKEAVDVYTKRIEMGVAYKDEWIFAILYKARCQRASGDIDGAISTLHRGIAEDTDWAEFWMELAYIYYDLKQYQKCIGVCTLARHCINKQTSLWREPNKYTDQPLRFISFCCEMLGKKDEALEWAKIAKAAIGVEDKSWDERIKVLSSKRIALYRPGALGDVIMTLNLIGPIKKKYPEYYIDYYCSKEIGDSIGYLMKQAGIDEIYEYGGLPHSSYEREIRLVGYPLNEGYPYTKMRKHLLEYFGDEAGVTVDPNLCMLLPKPEALVSGKYITIHATAGWSKYKNWDIANWEKIVKHYPDIVFYQIGSANDPKIEGAIHTYMGTEIKNSINLIANAQFHLGVDSFTNHLSHIVWTDSEGYNKHTSAIILWGSTQWDAAGYLHNCNISLNLECQPCFREDLTISTARTDPCPNNHKCMQMISVDRVVIEIDKYLKNIDQMALLNVLT